MVEVKEVGFSTEHTRRGLMRSAKISKIKVMNYLKMERYI